MPNAKISALPPATSVLTTDEFPINQGGTTKKVTLEQIQNSVSVTVGFPTGGIMMFAVSGVPTGWLECDGSVLPINNYTNLYNVIGQNYKTLNTFNTLSAFQIPDLRGQFVRGWNHGRTTGGDTEVNRGIGTSQMDEFKSHTHEYLGKVNGNYPFDAWNGYDGTGMVDQTTSATGGSETRPKNIALVYCIKA
jgi:microcystin-dependent protein